MALAKLFFRQYWLYSAAGAVVLGVTLPVLLVSWHNGFAGLLETLSTTKVSPPPVQTEFGQALGNLAVLQALATLFCAPGAVVLSIFLHSLLRWWEKRRHGTAEALISRGAVLGVILAWVNFPGWWCWNLLDSTQPLTALRFAALFGVAGATSGAWIAWQAYRANHNEERLFPRYSLSTLLILVLLWGALLALFRP